MSKGIYSGVSSEAQKVTKMYLGVSDKAHKIKKGYIGAMNFESRELPSGYTQVEYIQSSGTQYIDTGFTAKNTTKIVADCEITYGSGWIMILGSYDSSAYFSWWAQGTNLRPYFASSNKTIAGPSGRMTLVADGNIWSANDTSSSFTSSTFTATSSTYLFSVNNGGNYTNATMKLYSCQIYDNGTLVRDFVPCKNSSGTAGLYDLVNSKFYTNAGTGNFTAGNELMEVAKLFYISQLTGSISVDNNSITIKGINNTLSVSLTYVGDGIITAISNDPTIASANISGNTVIIKAHKAGTTTVEISIATTDNYTGDNCTISVNIELGTISFTDTTLELSTGRRYIDTTSFNGEYAFFAGGEFKSIVSNTAHNNSAVVDVFSKGLQRISVTGLAVARTNIAATSTSKYAMFSGGGTLYATGTTYRSYIDIYDMNLVHSYINMAITREKSGATSLLDCALVAGGWQKAGTLTKTAIKVDNNLTQTDLTDLRSTRNRPSGGSNDNYAIFAGGNQGGSTYTTNVDAYDKTFTKYNASLGIARANARSARVGKYALFIAGSGSSSTANQRVEAFDDNLTRTTATNLSTYSYQIAAAELDGRVIVVIDSSSSTKVDIYDDNLTKTSFTCRTVYRDWFSAASVGNYVLIGGGEEYGTDEFSSFKTVEVYSSI